MTKRHLRVFVLVVVVLAALSGAMILLRRPDPGVVLLDAAERGDLQEVTRLVHHGVSINTTSSVKFGWTPLVGAIFHNETNVIRYLVDAGANVNQADRNGRTPLMWMTSWGDDAAFWVNYLIAHGASLDAKDKYGSTAFDYAKGDPPRPRLVEILEHANQKK